MIPSEYNRMGRQTPNLLQSIWDKHSYTGKDKMKFSLTALSPWTDIFNILSNARSVKVLVNGVSVVDEADLSRDEHNNVTLSVTTKKKK